MATTNDEYLKKYPKIKPQPFQSRAYGPLGALGPTPGSGQQSIRQSTTSGVSPSRTPTILPKLGPPNPALDPTESPLNSSLRYSPGQLNYPSNLGQMNAPPHWVSFYINVRESSKFSYATAAGQADLGESRQFTEGNGRLNRNTLSGSMSRVVPALGVIGGAALGAKIGNKLGSAIPAKSGLPGVFGAVGGGVLGADQGFTLGQRATDERRFKPDSVRRISTVINLAIQDRPNVRYGVDYQSTDLGTAGGLMGGDLLQGGVSMSDVLNPAGNINPEIARSLMLNLAQIPASIANAFGSNIDLVAMASLGAGLAPNPFREQVFKSVDNRTFAFEYKFVSRSKEEARAVQKIINEFKFHMHPEKSASGLFFVYPSEFEIEYMYQGKINQHLHKISSCVLENMVVDYGGQQAGFHTFFDGMPTEINMRLQFRELEVMTKERINQGY